MLRRRFIAQQRGQLLEVDATIAAGPLIKEVVDVVALHARQPELDDGLAELLPVHLPAAVRVPRAEEVHHPRAILF
jgi:hypothetical protein